MVRSSPYSVVLFDAYDTLWYQTRSHVEIWHGLLARLGHERPLGDIGDAVEGALGVFMPRYRAFETSGKPAGTSELDQMWEDWDVHILDHLGVELSRDVVRSKVMPGWDEDLALYPETAEALELLRSEGYRMAMVSNGVNQERSAGALGIADYSDVVVGSAHVGFSKPMPQIYELALSRLDIAPGEAVMVGDNRHDDVEGAGAAGIRGIHLDRDAEPSPGADVISDLWGVVELLRPA
jgi:putative hydrolase of the HAD superfamily